MIHRESLKVHATQFETRHSMNSASDQPRYLPLSLRINGAAIVAALGAWFEAHGRTFPWRIDTESARELVRRGEQVNDPYIVLVSEVMLQQTQTSRVASMLPRFLERFPTVHALAAASRGDVLRSWQGLGYNNRAVRLHEAACAIVQTHGGVFPTSVEELRTLRGIGGYTAAAIACFAFGAQVPVVDVNIQRVLSRLFYQCRTIDGRMAEEAITRLDAELLPDEGAYWWHQALMDHGATICTARRPACERCPLVEHCLSAYPSTVPLFGSAAVEEPMIGHAPRRIWRGRIVELLRSADRGGIAVGELINKLKDASRLGVAERERLRDVIALLVEEGMLVVETAIVREPAGVTDETIVRLPL
jgi:A/G-specific adenine glycosylase